ncbi:MAG: DnaJ C-terminal domain-containing protein [Collinsella sp.]
MTARAARLLTKNRHRYSRRCFDRSQLRVSGFGEAGLRGEPLGRPDRQRACRRPRAFKRNGDDLYLVSDISIAQAALGCEIEVEGIMPDEVVKVTVPAGTQYGDTVSVNNYGMPRIGGGGSRGRLIVQLRVVVPTNLSNKQRELLRAFADEMGDDVASGKKSVTDRIKSALDDILD